MTKQDIRTKVREQKKCLSQDEQRSMSVKIQERLYAESVYQEATVLYCYVSYNQEVDTRKIIHQALKDGKRVAVPKVLDKHKMEFYYITSLEDLRIGYQGILEPVTDAIASGDGLMLFPGLAFDRLGNRIGYGGGFYDTYLNTHKDTKFYSLALAYDFQYFDEVPTEEHDHMIQLLLTPNYRVEFTLLQKS